MTDTPLIRAARALGEALYGYADPEETPNNWARAMSGARAVLEAVREPSEGQIEAGINQAEECTDNWTASAACVAEHCWRTMIDAALSE